ncbi:MAG: hypothetical protein EA406_02385 [Rhodospirillales bacterium]|nr:MAG: hypothetical protein EA406_02385 [Rhodospirillales bacterium]
MPKELRKVTFSADELQAALVNHCLHAGKSMPRGRLERIELNKASKTMAVMHFDAGNANDSELLLTPEDVGAALIRFCKQQRIPLPRNARKGVQVEDDGVALMCNLDYGVD